MKKIVIHLVLLVIWCDQLAFGNAATAPNMVDYYKMPKLSVFDDYDRCFQETTEKMTYCIVDSTIKPDNSSSLWKYIKKLSDDYKHNFRHDRLQRGICIKWCKEMMQSVKNDTDYYLGEFENHNVVKYNPSIYRNSIAYNVLYNEVVNECVNYKLHTEHNLMAYSTVEYCITNKDIKETDSLHVLFVVILIGITLTVLASSMYDHYLKKYQESMILQEKNQGHASKATDILIAFSLQRNWRRLVHSKRSEENSILNFIDPLRFMTMLLVVSAHTVYFSMQYPVANPDNVESIFYSFTASILLNGYVIVQTFFLFSGLLQAVGFTNYIKTHKTPNLNFIWNATFYRYLRLTPVYALMILFHATYSVTLNDGPFWPRLEETQRYYCRKNWWANLLYINNYVNVSELCMLQSWYLSADFQLFVLASFLLYIIWKYPQYKFYMLSVAMTIAFAIPGIVTYNEGLEGVMQPLPEQNKFNMIENEPFQKMYTPTHTNMGCYLIGMWFGFWVDSFKTKNKQFDKGWFHKFGFYTVTIIGFPTIMSGYIFYVYDFEKPSLLCGIYASLQKHMFALGTVYVMWCLSNKVENLVREFLKFKLFHILGKLTYCAFLVHIFIIQTTFGYNQQPLYISGATYIISSVVTLVMSYFISLLLCLFIEFPTSALQKLMFSNNRTKYNCQNNNTNVETS